MLLVALGACAGYHALGPPADGWARRTIDDVFTVDLPDSVASAEIEHPSDFVITTSMPAGEGGLKGYSIGWRWYRRRDYHGNNREWSSAEHAPQFQSVSPHGVFKRGLSGLTIPEQVYEARVQVADGDRLVVFWVHEPLLRDSAATSVVLSSVRLASRGR